MPTPTFNHCPNRGDSHTAAGIRAVPITDVTISIPSEVIAGVLAHHRRAPDSPPSSPAHDCAGAGDYRAESLDTLFGRRSS
jgi:hypothetical protein